MTTTSLFRPFDVSNPLIGSVREEWAPHAAMSRKSFEWWYITALLHDDRGHAYFYFLSVAHFLGEDYQNNLLGNVAPDGTSVLGIGAMLSDYHRQRVTPLTTLAIMPRHSVFDPARNRLRADAADGATVSWSYGDSAMELSHTTPQRLSLQASLTNIDHVLWHQDEAGAQRGIEGFIQQGAENDFSFYYSLPNAELAGTLTLPGDDGEPEALRVSGRAWVDRQWGDFATLFWEWSSFRFNNGASVHIYNFYNGHQEAVYQTTDGVVHRLKEKVIVRQNGYVKSPTTGTWVSWGWSYEFPLDIEGSRRFTVKPYGAHDFLEYPTLKTHVPVVLEGYALFEGAGCLIDDITGKIVGISINESADIRAMRNGPYDEQQR